MTEPGAGLAVSLIIPAFDEEDRLADLFAALARDAEAELELAGFRYAEAVIVDDGSSDATAALLQEAAAGNDRIRPVLGRPANLGKGAAIAAGVAAARGEMVLMVDVDLSTPLAEASKLARALRSGNAAIAIGSRDLQGARVVAPLHRRVLGAGFNLAVRALTGLRYADTQCGFKLMETTVARDLLREQISLGFAFDVELLMRAGQTGLGVVEVPVTYIHDHRSKVRLVRASIQMARDLVRVSVGLRLGGRRARRTRPQGDSPPI